MASAGNIMLRSQFADLFESRLPYIDEILFDQYDAPSMVYPEVFNVRPSDRAYEEMTQLAGLGRFTQKTEGAPVDYDSLLQGFDKRFTHLTYAKGWQISFEAMADDIDGYISDATPALARSARISIEATLAQDWIGAFDATTVADGTYLCANSHTLMYGTGCDNRVDGDLSQVTLETALNQFAAQVDLRGELVEIEPRILLIPYNLQWLAHELLDSALRSDTTANAINVLNRLGLRIVTWKYLTDEDDWFLVSDPSQHRVMCYWRMEPVVDHAIDFDTGNGKTKMTYRLSHGAVSYLGVVGGKGA